MSFDLKICLNYIFVCLSREVIVSESKVTLATHVAIWKNNFFIKILCPLDVKKKMADQCVQIKIRPVKFFDYICHVTIIL